MRATLPGEVAWYVTGRFYVTENGSILDVGYFLHLQGISSGLFQNDQPGEGTAFLTFAADPFQAQKLTNGDLTLGLDTVGEFGIYLNRAPGATFDNPASFAAGEEIARFRRVSMVVGVTVGGGGVSVNLFSAELLWSKAFELGGGERQDLRELIPHGVTQSGTASTTALPAPAGYTTAVPFVGSAFAIG